MNQVCQLRCVGCALIKEPRALPESFRCEQCGELFEVFYPTWTGPKQTRPNPSALRWLWKERRMSMEAPDRSGVWRFREMLPILNSENSIVSLAEGNTPLYDLLRARERLQIGRAQV